MISSALNILTLGLELAAAAFIFAGAIEAVYGTICGLLADRTGSWKRGVWTHYAAWIALSLEFALGADIVATIENPSWDELGKLALLAMVRTVLNFFLTRDLERDLALPQANKASDSSHRAE